MQLEQIEQDTLNYLDQSTNPLVRVHVVYEQVTSRTDAVSISMEEYLDFLRHHDLMDVTDPLALADDDDMLQSLAGAGLPMEPCVILKSRVPSSQDLGASMVEQLTTMTDALAKALQEARGTGDPVRGHELFETLGRIESLKKRIIEHIKQG